MRISLSNSLASLAVALSLWSLPVYAAETLRMGGMGGASALLVHLGRVFTQQTGIEVEVLPSLGTGGGLTALTEDVLDVSVAGRKLKPDELARGLVEVVALRTPYVLVTAHPAPAGLQGRDVVAAYAADRAAWPDGVPLRIILRPRSDSETPVLGALFPSMDAAMNQARQRNDSLVAPSDQDNADLAEQLPGSLTGMTYSQLRLERRNLRAVALANVAPTLEAFESGAYPHGRTLRLIHAQGASATARRFVQFLQTDEAARAMREAFCLPVRE